MVEAGLLSRQWDDLTSSAVTLGVLQRLGLVCPLAPPPPLYGQSYGVGYLHSGYGGHWLVFGVCLTWSNHTQNLLISVFIFLTLIS